MKTKWTKMMRTGLLSIAVVSPSLAVTVTPLDDPLAGPKGTVATGISGGNIVGWYFDSSNSDVYHGFLFNGTQYTPLDDPLGTQGTQPNGISGVNIVGNYYDASGGHGFLFDGTKYTTLDDPLATQGTSYVTAISGSNIVGAYRDSSGKGHGFLYNGTQYTTLPDDPSVDSSLVLVPSGISGSNMVGSYNDLSGVSHGFLYDGSKYVTLDDPVAPVPFYGTTVTAIDGSNIAGYYGQNVFSFIYNGGAYSTVEDLGAGQGRNRPFHLWNFREPHCRILRRRVKR